MSYLSRESSSLSNELWSQIDSTVVKSARSVLTGRRFLHLVGPLGAGTQAVPVDDADSLKETDAGGLKTVSGRKFIQLPILYEDFKLLARDLESADQSGLPVDLSKAARAAQNCALKEDKLIFFGKPEFGYDGLLTVEGARKIPKKDWSTGENAFTDIASGITYFAEAGINPPYALAVSPDLYLQMERLQPGTGLLEIDRVSKMLDGHLYLARALGQKKAVLAGCDAINMDLVVGQDMAAAYLEQTDMNHSLRVVESVLLRIKRKEAVAVFEE